MTTTNLDADSTAIDLAREFLYRFLAAALTDPRTDGWRLLLDPESQRLAVEAVNLLQEEVGKQSAGLGFGELPIEQFTLETLRSELEKPIEEMRRNYDQVFGLVYSCECPPYETEYHSSSEAFFRSQQMADIAGFYRAFGLETSNSSPERPDHIALELEFIAFLLMKKRLALDSAPDNPEGTEQARVCQEALQRFFSEHLVWWVPAFTMGMRRKAHSAFYAEVGRVLAAFLPIERGWLGVPPPRLPVQPDLIERPEEQSGCAGCSVQS